MPDGLRAGVLYCDDPQKIRRAEEVSTRLAAVMARPSQELLATIGGRRSGVKLRTDLDPETAERVRQLGISGLDLEAYPHRIYPQGPLFANVVGFLNLERVPQAGLEQSRDSDLKRQETAQRIRDLGISGLDLEAYPQRLYPQGQLFANVVGFLNLERVPQAGLEQSRDRDLRRQETPFSMRRGADGTPLPDGIRAGSLYGDDLRLQLTLDARLQQVAQSALARQVRQWNAKRGAALVMDARSGEMLALASTPSYDPNRFWSYNPGLFREWSVQDLYEPGSTFKPINLALALQEKAIDPHGTANDVGQLTIGGWPIFNADRRANGVIDFATVLQVSSNVAMVDVMSRVKRPHFWRWLHTLGIDDVPDTDLPGAVAGQLKSRSEFVGSAIEPATAAFGQGFSLTPLKLLQL
ncbi:MAG: peptidoglycan D,D-transpeptidase FtsI family protein, partial [Cyanobium sp.]